MELTECIEFAKQNPASSLATVEGDQPRVRGFMLWRADESGFYYQVPSTKQVYKQIAANPKVEMCFYNCAPELSDIKTLRVAGTVEVLDDKDLKKQLLDEWGFLPYKGVDDPELVLFRVAHGDAHFWSMADVGKGKQDLEVLEF